MSVQAATVEVGEQADRAGADNDQVGLDHLL
jgi:hypothetical protein